MSVRGKFYYSAIQAACSNRPDVPFARLDSGETVEYSEMDSDFTSSEDAYCHCNRFADSVYLGTGAFSHRRPSTGQHNKKKEKIMFEKYDGDVSVPDCTPEQFEIIQAVAKARGIETSGHFEDFPKTYPEEFIPVWNRQCQEIHRHGSYGNTVKDSSPISFEEFLRELLEIQPAEKALSARFGSIDVLVYPNNRIEAQGKTVKAEEFREFIKEYREFLKAEPIESIEPFAKYRHITPIVDATFEQFEIIRAAAVSKGIKLSPLCAELKHECLGDEWHKPYWHEGDKAIYVAAGVPPYTEISFEEFLQEILGLSKAKPAGFETTLGSWRVTADETQISVGCQTAPHAEMEEIIRLFEQADR